MSYLLTPGSAMLRCACGRERSYLPSQAARLLQPYRCRNCTSLANHGWQPVRFTADCDPGGEGWCQVMDVDPTECDCIGPTEDDVEYSTHHGVLYGRREA